MKRRSVLPILAVVLSLSLGQQADRNEDYTSNIVLPMKPLPPPTCYDNCRETCVYICKATKLSNLTFLATVKTRKKPRTELDLSFNNLNSLKKNEISATDFKIVRKVYLEHNQITYIDQEALDGLDFLEELYLSGNPLTTFFKNSFDSQSLDTLMLDSCGIKNLPNGIFKNTPNLKLINLNNNTITEITNEMFKTLPNLEEIHVGGNLLSDLDKDTFKGLHNLKILNLTHNRITHLKKGLLKELPSLIDLQLAYNLLKVIDTNTLKDNINLVSVNLASNFIDTIQEGLFAPLKQLRSIKLNDNKLTTLKMQIFEELISNSNYGDLRVGTEYVFDLENNPWSCEGCDMFKVFHWLRENTTQDYHFKWSVMVCASPERFKDKSWTFVPWDKSEENCVEPPSLRNVTKIAEVTTIKPEVAAELSDAFSIRPEYKPTINEVKNNAEIIANVDTMSNETSVQLMEYIKETSNICVFQYYFLGSYALFVLISACTVWIIIYKEKVTEMQEERY